MTDLPRPVVAIPLADAAICLSCPQEAIFYLPGSNRCPLCASEHFALVQGFLGSMLRITETAGSAGTDPATTERS